MAASLLLFLCQSLSPERRAPRALSPKPKRKIPRPRPPEESVTVLRVESRISQD
jgi:hypothetical protein